MRGYGPWGFLDVWRRKKGLWWDAKLMHSPIWVPVRRLEIPTDRSAVSIPLEDRYSFTNLSEVKATWELGNLHGRGRLELPPQSAGAISQSSPGLKCFPILFATRRQDRNVFNPNGLPYAQFPDEATRTRVPNDPVFLS